MTNPNCARCGALKEERGYRTSYCKACQRQMRTEWSRAHPERTKAAQQRHRDTDHYKARSKAYRAIERSQRGKVENKIKFLTRDYRYKLRQLYGLELQELYALQAAQQDRCAICGELETNARVKSTTPTGAKVLAVDHDHVTGVIRALLCYRCNVSIGRVNENPELLRKMLDYLGRHKATQENQVPLRKVPLHRIRHEAA
jgi:hypothetical protein